MKEVLALHAASKEHNPLLYKGILVFDEVKVAAKLHWNSCNNALIGHSMTAQEMATLCDLYEKLEKDEEPRNTDYVM